MQSMTGYGRGQASLDGRTILIELKTVNHRALDIQMRLPRTLTFLEVVLRTCLRESPLVKGHVDVMLTYQNTREDAKTIQVDQTMLAVYVQAVQQQQALLSSFAPSTVIEVLTACDAIHVEMAQENIPILTALAKEAMAQAIEALHTMRLVEGAALVEDCKEKIAQLMTIYQNMQEQAPKVPLAYRERLTSRLQEWNIAEISEERLIAEVAIMADRVAIDEELQRLHSHLVQWGNILLCEEPVGRKLEFLLQEINRECNTIGSKASDITITKWVVEAKCLVEKLREQVQNIV